MNQMNHIAPASILDEKKASTFQDITLLWLTKILTRHYKMWFKMSTYCFLHFLYGWT